LFGGTTLFFGDQTHINMNRMIRLIKILVNNIIDWWWWYPFLWVYISLHDQQRLFSNPWTIL